MSNTFQLVNTNLPTLFNQLNNNKIDLDAEYQRDVVWNNGQRSEVINSIYKNYPIGLLLFNNDNKKTFTKICMDGKQRLTSIKQFMNNEFCFHNNNTNEYIYYSQNKADGRKLKPKEKNMFDKYAICLQEYNDLDYSTQCDMFSRIQNGTPLTEMEKLVPCFKQARVCPDTFKKYIHNISEFVPHLDRQTAMKFGIDCLIFFKEVGKQITWKKRQQHANSYSNVKLKKESNTMTCILKLLHINFLKDMTIINSDLLVIICYLINKNIDSITLEQVKENLDIINEQYNTLKLENTNISTKFEEIKTKFIVSEKMDLSKLTLHELRLYAKKNKIRGTSNKNKNIIIKIIQKQMNKN